MTFAIALVGAVTGILALGLQWRQHRLMGPRIRVEIEEARVSEDAEPLVRAKVWAEASSSVVAAYPLVALAIRVVNRGGAATSIERWGCYVDETEMSIASRDGTPLNPPLPFTVEAHCHVTLIADWGLVAATRAEAAERGEGDALKGYVALGSGKEIFSDVKQLGPDIDIA